MTGEDKDISKRCSRGKLVYKGLERADFDGNYRFFCLQEHFFSHECPRKDKNVLSREFIYDN